MKRLFFFLILFLGVSFATQAQEPVKRALVFGLGEQLDPSWGKINGDKDVDYVKLMLSDTGYTDVVVLKNKQATKQAMVNAFVALANRCRKGDVVYVHYSGHGQLMTDVDGDESLKWEGKKHSQWDEAWVPYDAFINYCEADKGEKHLSDDEVAMYLTAIRKKVGPEGEIMVVIDACHSGDATCANADVPVPPVRGIGVKFNIPLQPLEPGEVVEPQVVEEQWLTVSASKPFQLNTEMGYPNVGKLTYALYSIGAGAFSKDADELQKLLRTFMEQHKGYLPQSPMVTGAKKAKQ